MLDPRGQLLRASTFATEVPMRLIGLAVALTVSVLLAPLAADAQLAGKSARAGGSRRTRSPSRIGPSMLQPTPPTSPATSAGRGARGHMRAEGARRSRGRLVAVGRVGRARAIPLPGQPAAALIAER